MTSPTEGMKHDIRVRARPLLGSFSVERLMDFLTALGRDVEITVKPARKRHGEVSLVA